MTSLRPLALLLALTCTSPLLAGCGDDGSRTVGSGPPPDTTGTKPDTQQVLAVIEVSPSRPQLAIVGDTFDFDASRGDSVFRDRVGGGLRYVVDVPAASGLAIRGARVAGRPVAAGVYPASIVATDARGQSAFSQFLVVVMSRDLPVPVLPATRFAYSDEAAPLPAHFRTAGPGGTVVITDNTPASNRTTDAGATLGRVLFHDRRLSANDRVSCASCHLQQFGFSDTAKLSRGFDGRLTRRHSMPLANARFYRRGRFFWDERAATLEQQVLMPIQDNVEMGMPIEALEVKLAAVPYYAPLFRAAFGSDTVTSERIARALAQYVRSIVSGSSRLDSALANDGADFERVLTAEERQGFALFTGEARCATCHATHVQLGTDPANNGLDATITDPGIGFGRFKPPSLRNVALRRRFMHDGRFDSLEQVIVFYTTGVAASQFLDGRMRGADGGPQRFDFTAAQRAALVAYLRTLTDPVVTTAEKFADPFPAAQGHP